MVLDTLVVQGLNKRGAECGGPSSLASGASGMGISFSREDLSRILKFGATKLWKQSRPKGCEEDDAGGSSAAAAAAAGTGGGEGGEFSSFAEKPAADVDLDLILAEAEVTITEATEGEKGLADSLLSSYKNIQEFKYEPSESAAAADNDAEFWSQCIPAHERLKLKKQKEEQLIVHGKRRTRNALLGWGVVARGDDSPDSSALASLADGGGSAYASDRGGSGGFPPASSSSYDDAAAAGDPAAAAAAAAGAAAGTGGRGRRGRRPRVLNPTQLTAKEYHRLYRALLRYGCIDRRLEDIVSEAKLQRVSSAVVVAAAQHIVSVCQERLRQGPSKAATTGGGAGGSAAASAGRRQGLRGAAAANAAAAAAAAGASASAREEEEEEEEADNSARPREEEEVKEGTIDTMTFSLNQSISSS
ncbi:hypothetical protein Emag_004043 [Eimeria magna]